LDGNYTLSDIAAVTDGNRNNNGMFGGDWSAWIILFLLFGMFGGGWGNGLGGFGGYGGGSGFQGMATRADINEGFALNGLQTGITAIQQGICDSTYALNNSITGGFNGISRQLADCCCTTQRAIDGVNFNIAKGFCDIGNVVNSSTRDILENNNTNTRAILDFLTQDKIATLTAENQNLKLSASQANQNAVLMAAMDANKAEILRRTGAECPTPAYVVQPPTPVHFPYNNCGCGNNYAFGYAG
jgi:hypothetical protein